VRSTQAAEHSHHAQYSVGVSDERGGAGFLHRPREEKVARSPKAQSWRITLKDPPQAYAATKTLGEDCDLAFLASKDAIDEGGVVQAKWGGKEHERGRALARQGKGGGCWDVVKEPSISGRLGKKEAHRQSLATTEIEGMNRALFWAA